MNKNSISAEVPVRKKPFDKERVSKALSYFLRHSIEFVDAEGWAETGKIVAKLASQFEEVTFEMLEQIVAEDRKKRCSFDSTGAKIRANYGHSNLRLRLEPVSIDAVPDTLYHGSASRFLESIMAQGLLSMTRSYVHLSTDPDTAYTVGKRHGKPIVLCIDAKQLVGDGQSLYCSDGIWLADFIPARYLKTLATDKEGD